LHPAAGPAGNMADLFEAWGKDGYVVCAPQARDITWEAGDLKRVLAIAAQLKKVLPIDPARVHVLGYSDGGNNLCPLAFDDDLRPRSVTWVASSYTGAQVPKWARRGLGALFLCGTDDPERRGAEKSVGQLRGKVRSVEIRLQPELGHGFPRDLRPYLRWWMGVQEGRFVAGEGRVFEWKEDLDAALASLKDVKKGGVLVYVFSGDDADKPSMRALQQEVFLDEAVRFFGLQLRRVRVDRSKHADVAARLGVEATPALVVLDRRGKVKAVHVERTLTPGRVAKSLRQVAPRRRMPK
ncbi:MAG: hypothetical protein ACC662_07525, partial [Planctomycetota bacterium]